MSFQLSPIGNESQVDSNGAPLSGGKIETYVAGSTTPAATYTDITGGTPQTNPIVLNVLGLPPQPIWMDSAVVYKFIIKDMNGVVQRTIDNISGISSSSPLPADQWIIYSGGSTYISATSFSLSGDQTSIFQPGRRVRTVNTGGVVYSSILTSVFSAGVTTMTLLNDSGVLDIGLSQVSYGILSSQNDSEPVTTRANLMFGGVLETSTTGTSPNFVLTPSPPIAALLAGQRFRVKFHSAGTANPLTNYTLNISGLGAKNIFALSPAGGFNPSIIAGVIYDIEYDGTNMIVLNSIDGSSRCGEYIYWPGNFTPPYALLCNGAAVSRSTYARLFSQIGTAFGAGDGSTTFNLPNITAGYTLANSNGANAGTTTVGDNLAHTHTTTFYGTSGSGTAPSSGGSPVSPTNQVSNSTGGAANLAAAMYARICIIF